MSYGTKGISENGNLKNIAIDTIIHTENEETTIRQYIVIIVTTVIS